MVSAKTFEKIKERRRFEFGWVEERGCGRYNDKKLHSVYLTGYVLNNQKNAYYPTKIAFYVCECCGNYQGV